MKVFDDTVVIHITSVSNQLLYRIYDRSFLNEGCCY